MYLVTGYASADGASKLDAMIVNSDWLGETSEERVKTYAGSREVLTNQELHERGALNLEDYKY